MLDVVSFFVLLFYYIYVGVSWFTLSLIQWLVFIVFPTGWNPYTFYVWTAWTLGVCGVFNVSLGGRDMYVKMLYKLFEVSLPVMIEPSSTEKPQVLVAQCSS